MISYLWNNELANRPEYIKNTLNNGNKNDNNRGVLRDVTNLQNNANLQNGNNLQKNVTTRPDHKRPHISQGFSPMVNAKKQNTNSDEAAEKLREEVENLSIAISDDEGEMVVRDELGQVVSQLNHTDKTSDDPQYIKEYQQDILDHLKHAEKDKSKFSSPRYMSKQPHIDQKVRSMLIDWLIEVHWHFRLSPQAIYLTVNIIDRFLCRRIITMKKMQLVGCTALFIATKYEELFNVTCEDIIHVARHGFDKDHIIFMESVILSDLHFELTFSSSYAFSEFFLLKAQANEEIFYLTNFLLELSLLCYDHLKFSSSLIAASAVWLARYTITNNSHWESVMSEVTGYSLEEMAPTIKSFHHMLKYPSHVESSVRLKYSKPSRREVSKLAPPIMIF